MNNSNSPWTFVNHKGVGIAFLVPYALGIPLNPTERLVLARLYGALVRNTDIIDIRVTQVHLATHLDLSLSSVVRAYRKLVRLGLIEPLDGGNNRRSYLLRVPLEELEEKIQRNLGHEDIWH
jgi:DNA-binding MarR family transcriptional regulator